MKGPHLTGFTREMGNPHRLTLDVHGARLEAERFTNAAAQSPQLALVLVHPYSWLGGSYEDPVVTRAWRLACRHPNVALALRYNQRGVGSSTGWSSFWGGADCRDLKQLCTELAAQSSPAVQLAVIGYSWGACLAASAIHLPSVHGYLGISPPVGWLANFALRSKRHFGAAQQALAHKPCQLLMGTRDQFTSAHTVRKWVQSFNRTLTGSAEDTGCAMQLSVVETASHFWETRQARQELSEAIDLFITSLCSHPGRTMTPAR